MQTDKPANWTFIRNAFGDEVLHDINRNAFDREGSAAVFARHFGISLRRKDSLYILIGTDSALLAQWLLSEDLPEGTRYLFIEPAHVIETIRARLPEIENQPRVLLSTPEEWQAVAKDFQFQEYAFLENIHVKQSIGAADAYLSDYRSIHWEVQSKVKEITWSIEFQLGSQAFVMRQIENIADNREPAICIKDAFAGRTAVLLGGGPSLDELLPWLKTHRSQVCVIAVSRICRRLLQAELQPDLVVSIDPHDLSFDVSKEMLRFDEKTLLVHSYHVSPLLLAQWHGPAVYFGERLPWRSKANVENLKNQGPTVTNTALSIAVQMGFARIILGGVDLCYSREGHTHAQGSNERNAGPLLGNVGVQVETNGGWMADTRHSFATAVDIMGSQATAALQQDCHIINPAAAAAKIPNVEHIPLPELKLEQFDLDCTAIVSECLPANTDAHRRAHYQAMLTAIARANGRLREIGKLAEQALECNDGLFGRNGKSADFKYKKRMDKIEKRLDREYKDISPLVKNFGSRSFLRLVRPHKERDWSDEDIEKWGRAYYEIYQKSTQSLIELLETARQRVSARLAEEQVPWDWPLLLQQWQADRTPGRAHVWRHWHPQAYAQLGAEQQELLEQTLQSFEQVLQATDTEQAKWCADNYTLAPVRSKLQILFQQQDTAELQRSSDELRKLDSSEAQALRALAEGYLAELNGDIAAAMQHYQVLLDDAVVQVEGESGQLPRSSELEDAMRRLSALALEIRDDQSALVLLRLLTDLSQSYAPQYAELQRLTGDLQGAVDTYSSYLESAPNDFGAMLKLGQIFQRVAANDSAAWAYRYVLEKDPGNRAAQTLLDSLPVSA